MRTGPRIRLVRALLWRSWREQGAILLIAPLGFALLLLGVTLLALNAPGVLTPTTRAGLEAAAHKYFSGQPGRVGLALAGLLAEGPYLLGIFASFLGATAGQSSLGNERARGGLEAIFALPYTPEEILTGFLGASVALTLVSWLILTLASLGVAIGVLVTITRAGLHLSGSYLTLALFVPLPLALWANLISVVLAVVAPRLAQVRTGSTGNLTQLVAILPAIVVFLVAALDPQINLTQVAAGALGVGIVGSAVFGTVLGRRLSPEAVLGT